MCCRDGVVAVNSFSEDEQEISYGEERRRRQSPNTPRAERVMSTTHSVRVLELVLKNTVPCITASITSSVWRSFDRLSLKRDGDGCCGMADD